MKKASKFVELLLVPFLILVLFLLSLNSIFQESRVYDENLHIDAGYKFLTEKDFRVEPFNPPLARELTALPLLFNQRMIEDPILFWPRMITVAFSVLLAMLVYLFAKKAFGLKAGILALILYVFEPNILAHSHYATTDLILSFFIFLTIFLFWLWKNKFNLVRVATISIIFGLSLSVKFSALPFLLFSILGIFLFENRKKLNNLINLEYFIKNLKYILAGLVFMLISLWSTYFFTSEPILGLRFDSNREAAKLAKTDPIINFALNQSIPLGSYISTVKQMGLYNYSEKFKKEAFLFGQLSESGFVYYFPLAFLIKTPIPLIVLFLLTLFLSLEFTRNNIVKLAVVIARFRRIRSNLVKSRLSADRHSHTRPSFSLGMNASVKHINIYLLVPIVVIFLFMSFSKVNLGLRYILPAYPFIIVFSSQIINHYPRFKSKYLLIGILLLWYMYGTLKTSPHFISYFNELVGGSQNGYKYLIDSNYDWGQGLMALERYQRENNIDNLELAYFGSISPTKYGIKYNRIQDKNLGENKNNVNIIETKSKVTAISATCWYYCGYYKNEKYKNLKPVDIVGGSILIFKR